MRLASTALALKTGAGFPTRTPMYSLLVIDFQKLVVREAANLSLPIVVAGPWPG